MEALKQECDALTEYLGNLLASTGGDSQIYIDACEDQKTILSARIQNTQLSLREASTLLGLLRAVPFTDAARTELLNAVRRATRKTEETNSNSNTKMQDYTAISQYTHATLVARMKSDRIDGQSRLLLLLRFAAALGLKWMSEDTAASLTALHLWNTEGDVYAVPGKVKLITSKHVKATWKKLAVGLPTQYVRRLPANPEHFRAEYPRLWAAAIGNEVLSPMMSLTEALSIASPSVQPRRSTSKLVDNRRQQDSLALVPYTKPTASLSEQGMFGGNAAECFQMMFQMFQNNMQQQPQPMRPKINILGKKIGAAVVKDQEEKEESEEEESEKAAMIVEKASMGPKGPMVDDDCTDEILAAMLEKKRIAAAEKAAKEASKKKKGRKAAEEKPAAEVATSKGPAGAAAKASAPTPKKAKKTDETGSDSGPTPKKAKKTDEKGSSSAPTPKKSKKTDETTIQRAWTKMEQTREQVVVRCRPLSSPRAIAMAIACKPNLRSALHGFPCP